MLVTDPNSINALQIKGMVALSRGKTDEGLKYADKVLVLSPGNEAGVMMRARALALDGDISKGLAEAEAALPVTGRTPGMLITLINLHRANSDGEAMKAYFPELVEQTKGAPAFLIDQANLHYRLGDKPTARRAIVRVLAEGSINLNDYGSVYRLWSEYDDAPLDEASIRAIAQSKDPVVPVSTIRQLLVMRALGPAGGLLDALPPDRRQQLRGLQARVLDLGGRKDAALRVAETVLAEDSENVDALLVRGPAYLRSGKANLALNDSQRAVQNDPTNVDAYLVLADVNIALGEKWRARQVLEDGVKRLPQSYELVSRYTQFLQTLKDKGRAISVTTMFARQSPASQRAWTLLAAQCLAAANASCKQAADKGLAKAKTLFELDNPPGSPQDRGIFSKIK
jgi:tetratricopeptide (TPR) repeat protein